jgi:hypothetical protein
MSISAAEFKPGFNAVTSNGVFPFISTQVLTDGTGDKLGRFNIFSAPQDFDVASSGRRKLLSFGEAAEELGTQRDYLGRKTCRFGFKRYEEQLAAGLRNGSAVGKWFIPTIQILYGRELPPIMQLFWDGSKVPPDNLFGLRNTGDLKDTFCTAVSNYGQAMHQASLSWSCSKFPGDPWSTWVVNFATAKGGWASKAGYFTFSVRPVFVEPAP